ncbi:MAG: hypothetical protein ACTSV3_02105 [Candidatus Thorarchaeota archaeon]|nr:MAG: hypothetical protein DRP09_12020 [Candidatus Thorarchaeota archaeon]RLI58092.1 MAG: hypothetical protein DRO87_06270 [Candidatus Thorarchaeota archaeon]
MSESAECPYCGARVPLDRKYDYDSSARVVCPNCGGTFEYLAGFGTFSVEGEEPAREFPRMTIEGSSDWERPAGFEEETIWRVQHPETEEDVCGSCCKIACCCLLLNIIIGMVLIGSHGGFLW